MPKTKRDRMKGNAALAVRNIKYAMEHLAELEAEFSPQHPELGEPLQAAIVGLDVVRDVILVFVREAWGYVPDDIEAWCNRK